MVAVAYSKCCTFLHHNHVSVDRFFCTQGIRLNLGSATPWHEEREIRQEITKISRERKNKWAVRKIRNELIRNKDLMKRWKKEDTREGNAIDPGTKQVWARLVHLHIDFFSNIKQYSLHNLWLIEFADVGHKHRGPQIWRYYGYRWSTIIYT